MPRLMTSHLENFGKMTHGYGATIADDQLLGDLAGTNGTVQRFFEASGLHLQRTIATERALADGIVSELKRRKVGLGSAGGTSY